MNARDRIPKGAVLVGMTKCDVKIFTWLHIIV